VKAPKNNNKIIELTTESHCDRDTAANSLVQAFATTVPGTFNQPNSRMILVLELSATRKTCCKCNKSKQFAANAKRQNNLLQMQQGKTIPPILNILCFLGLSKKYTYL
jgi:hypothetical protein